MAKKLKKVNKKPMNPKTKEVIVDSFKGLISNQSCVNNGKQAPWWLAIIFALVAIIIPLIPNFVRMSKAYGSSFLSQGSFGFDRGIAQASIALKNDNKDLVIQGDQHLHYVDSANQDIVLTSDQIYEGIYFLQFNNVTIATYCSGSGHDTNMFRAI